jgi:hypothetical protein
LVEQFLVVRIISNNTGEQDKMSYQRMKEINTIAEKRGIKLKTISDFIKFAKEFNYEKAN